MKTVAVFRRGVNRGEAIHETSHTGLTDRFVQGSDGQEGESRRHPMEGTTNSAFRLHRQGTGNATIS